MAVSRASSTMISLGMAAGVEREFAKPVDERIGVLEQCRQPGVDRGQVSAAADRRQGQPVRGGLLVTATRLGQGQRAPGNSRRVPEAEPLGLQLGVLAGANPNWGEVVDQVAGALQFGRAGARRPLGGGDGINSGAPRLHCGGGGRPRLGDHSWPPNASSTSRCQLRRSMRWLVP